MSEDTQTDTLDDDVETHDHDHDHDHEHEAPFEFVVDPEFDIEYKGDCAYEVKVVVAPVNEEKPAEEMYGELKTEAELPGFRRGKAPVKLIERKFGKYVKSEVAGKLVAASFQKLVKDEKLDPLGTPDVDGLEDLDERKEGDALAFTLKFEVRPRVELGSYRGLEIERPVVTIDKQDVEDAMQDLLERFATYEEVDEGEKAQEGDQVIIDFKGKIDGEEFQGGSAENYPYVLGSGRFFPEFEKALKGAVAGKSKRVKVTFPDDYFAEEVQGKEANFTIKVNEIKRKTLPEVDDDFAKEAGFESADDMRAKTEENLREHSLKRSAQIAESRALDAIVAASTYEIPVSLIESMTQEQRNQRFQQLIEARVSPEQMKSLTENIDEEAREAGIANIKRLVALNEIGDAEGISVEDEDFEKEALEMAKSVGVEVEMVAQYLAQGEQRNATIDRIYRAKTMAVIMDAAKITDKELTREEMEKAEAAEGDE